MWNGFRSEEFDFRGRKGIVVFPSCPANGKLLYKTEYWNEAPKFEMEMLSRGYHLCHMDHGDIRWGADPEIRLMAEFVAYVTEHYKVGPKCIPVGMSAGGLQATRFAQMYPGLVEGLYLDNPVLNYLRYTGKSRISADQEIQDWVLREYRMDAAALLASGMAPKDRFDVLTDHKIPVALVYGGKDDVVACEENSLLLIDHYQKKQGKIAVFFKPDGLHHPHGLEDCGPLAAFFEELFR